MGRRSTSQFEFYQWVDKQDRLSSANEKIMAQALEKQASILSGVKTEEVVLKNGIVIKTIDRQEQIPAKRQRQSRQDL